MSDTAGVRGVEIGIVTADASRLVVFYVEGLQFEVDAVFSFPRGTVNRLRRGNARCKVFQPVIEVRAQPVAEPWYSVRGISYGALLVDDAELEVSRAQAAGATVIEAVVSHRPGAKFALISDPEGNIWEILEEA